MVYLTLNEVSHHYPIIHLSKKMLPGSKEHGRATFDPLVPKKRATDNDYNNKEDSTTKRICVTSNITYALKSLGEERSTRDYFIYGLRSLPQIIYDPSTTDTSKLDYVKQSNVKITYPSDEWLFDE